MIAGEIGLIVIKIISSTVSDNIQSNLDSPECIPLHSLGKWLYILESLKIEYWISSFF